MSKTHYEILNIQTNATEAEIRNGYIHEALKYHPDRNEAGEATAQFQAIANAYYILSDPKRRGEYDDSNVKDLKISEEVNPFDTFADMFNDLMIPEVPNPSRFWQPIGSVAGVMLGFIVFNVPGAMIGAYYGNRAGKIRDMKGISVYDAYCKLSQERRYQILGNLGKQFLSAAISGGAALSAK